MVEQGLKQVMISAIDQDDLRRRVSESLVSGQSAKSSVDACNRYSARFRSSMSMDDPYHCAFLVAQRHLAVEHPAVFPIRPPDTSFVLEGPSRREAGSPARHNPFNVVGMNESRPLPPAHVVQGCAHKGGSPTDGGTDLSPANATTVWGEAGLRHPNCEEEFHADYEVEHQPRFRHRGDN